jgi:hypothetical protein
MGNCSHRVIRHDLYWASFVREDGADGYTDDKCRGYRHDHHAVASGRRTKPPKLPAQKFLFALVHSYACYEAARKRTVLPMTIYPQCI